jgi:Flp pilus assembly protein TadD
MDGLISFQTVTRRPGGRRRFPLPLLLLLGWLPWGCQPRDSDWASMARKALQAPPARQFEVLYPRPGTLFPPGTPPPTFRWPTNNAAAFWVVLVATPVPGQWEAWKTATNGWTPTQSEWQRLQTGAATNPVAVVVTAFSAASAPRPDGIGRTHFATSADTLGAPLFFREVNLPFVEAVRDPSKIRWRFGPVTSPQPPPIVLQNLPVCGNCHSFPRDGGLLAMDVDYANSKGSYIITPVAREMRLTTNDLITWDDYQRTNRTETFGLLSQISPDGRHVLSTVKDQSVFLPMPGLEFSQLFFPVKGILACYDRVTRQFQALPGADRPEFVQSNPAWSPDGQWVVFARARAHDLLSGKRPDKVLLNADDCREFAVDGRPFQYDLYRVPFNGGRGGVAEPLPGAATNGFSNFFPKYSPDGRWIVYCRAHSYMLLQPDSELWIIPATGGVARRLAANTARMNSWHTWSPDSRWLVFSSKANSPHTQLWLTHIDERGESTPPVVLEHLTAPGWAANLPEFVNTTPTGIAHIQERFLNDYSFMRAGQEALSGGDITNAIRQYQRVLALNPGNAEAHQCLGLLIFNELKDLAGGMEHSRTALRLNPDLGSAHFDLGMALRYFWNLGATSPPAQIRESLEHLEAAVRLLPQGLEEQYPPAELRRELATGLLLAKRFQEASTMAESARKLAPNDPQTLLVFARTLAATGFVPEALEEAGRALQMAEQQRDQRMAREIRAALP